VAQLYFRYSTMNAGKSAQVLLTYHNYHEQGKKALLFTSVLDDRNGIGYVESRIGLKKKAIIVNNDTNMYEMVKKNPCDCVIVDEVQFLKKHHILELSDIVTELNIPVIGYGLKNDAFNEFFEGSHYMLIHADKIEELKTICWYCNKKATRNLRIDENKKPVFEGPQIKIGGNDTHLPTCMKCYKQIKISGQLLPSKPKFIIDEDETELEEEFLTDKRYEQ
jgi:thymidine kinase